MLLPAFSHLFLFPFLHFWERMWWVGLSFLCKPPWTLFGVQLFSSDRQILFQFVCGSCKRNSRSTVFFLCYSACGLWHKKQGVFIDSHRHSIVGAAEEICSLHSWGANYQLSILLTNVESECYRWKIPLHLQWLAQECLLFCNTLSAE